MINPQITENAPAFYAIIPANVRYNKNLCPNAKLLYGEITALCNEKGYCWANNDYFAKLYGVSKVSVSKWISSLVDNDLVSIEIIYKEGTKEILYRYLRLVIYPIKEKFNTPIKEKLKDNNTVTNNTFNKKSNKKEIEENKNSKVEEYFLRFYQLYQKKGDRQTAFKTFLKLCKGAVNIETLIEDILSSYDVYRQVAGADLQYWKNASTFLNNYKDYNQQYLQQFKQSKEQYDTKRMPSYKALTREQRNQLDNEIREGTIIPY